MKFASSLSILASIVLFSCAAQLPAPVAQRLPSSIDECAAFNQLPAADKMRSFMDRHAATATELAHGQLVFDSEAMLASARFLAPQVAGVKKIGHESLDRTLTTNCDTLPTPQVKAMHALGTLAQGRLVLYPRAKRLNPSGVMIDDVDSPWTGLLDPSKNDGSVPLLIRFSIANPLLHAIEIGGKLLNPEFIPGVGIKFLVDGEKSVDLLAMESLAGQGQDQDYFKYEFSPDFSAHAPPGFNTSADGDEKTDILDRYEHNPLNERVMGWVGDRFFQAMLGVYKNLREDQIDRHSPAGPNPFIISLSGLARVDKMGRSYSLERQRRPWRLVLKPALDNIDAKRLDLIRDNTPFSTFHKDTTDFRAKLSHLQAGDRVYYVLAETRVGERFTMGEIVLDSSPFTSEFADREFYIQHEIDFDRSNGSGSIAEP